MTAFFRLLAALAALSIGAALAAQNPCPRTSARTVPHSETTGLPVNCGNGIRIELGGITFTSGDTVCPLFVVFTPEHEMPQPANADTRTEPYARVEGWVFRLQCQKHYFLFIGIGSSCVHVDRFPSGTFERLATVPCDR